jgi:ABC-type transport system substrate-binding protein
MFGDAELRKGNDGVLTTPSIPLLDPLIQGFRMMIPGGPRFYGVYEDAEVADLLTQARAEPDDVKRAELVVKAQAKFMAVVPSIPIVGINGSVYQGPDVTGAPASSIGYNRTPWASKVGSRN